MTKKRKKTKIQIRKAQEKFVGRSPVWLKTVAIAKMPHRPRVQGTFGAASDVVRIDPHTGEPIQE